MTTEPRYPNPTAQAMDERADSAPEAPAPGRGNPPQGDHTAAGGRPEHHDGDGGTGTGHKHPAGWPRYHGA